MIFAVSTMLNTLIYGQEKHQLLSLNIVSLLIDQRRTQCAETDYSKLYARQWYYKPESSTASEPRV